MKSESSQTPFDKMNRRELLGRGIALTGGAIAGLTLQSACTQSHEQPAAAATEAPPNLHPPVVQVKGGKLRGFRDGKTYTFLGIPYAEAERFELPKPVQPWDGIKNAQAWGPVCPIPEMTAPGVDEFVFPHRYWLQNEHCQVLNVWTQSARLGRRRSRSWSGCTAAASRTAPRWSPTPTTARTSASSATSWSSA